MPNNQALLNFDDTAREMLALLRRRLAFDLWMVTRVEESDWIVLYADDHGYDVHEGDVFRWTDSYCYRMVTQNGPRVIPDCSANLVYADAPINQQLSVGAYLGIPLTYSDGRLFGTLCAVHPTPLPDSITEELPLLELLAKMLGMILSVCLEMSNEARHLDYTKAESLRDELTGMYSRSGWDQLLASEEKRCRLYGHSACIISIYIRDLKQVYRDRGALEGERYLVKLSQIIQSTARKQDIVARTEDDRFAILAVESNLVEGSILLERLKLYLRLAQIEAATAIAVREPTQYWLSEVWRQADSAVNAIG